MAQFAENFHWAETSPLFARSLSWRALPDPFKYKNEYLVLALGEETAAKAVVSSILWCPVSSRLYRLADSQAQKVGRWAPAATRYIACATNLPFKIPTLGLWWASLEHWWADHTLINVSLLQTMFRYSDHSNKSQSVRLNHGRCYCQNSFWIILLLVAAIQSNISSRFPLRFLSFTPSHRFHHLTIIVFTSIHDWFIKIHRNSVFELLFFYEKFV